ncbi:MAG: hypothetical protein P0116_07010 [Candidatus Nitrosocosmicus sp.]|nr:hypothetical protein [Candidatus Nitrosocosmicus sp.]
MFGRPNLATAQQQIETKEKLDKLWEKFLNTKPEEWKTLYSPEYKFSIDYPVNNTKVEDDKPSFMYLYGKNISSPSFNMIVYVLMGLRIEEK